ncbi:DNA polymerase-3 subunit epsilon [Flavobacteriaceae bacterium MAR_2010_188]|nr:DNA polymerase-3 subunit epsilon [Flavobacteriaceae bacterium MAR_2010_188]
MLRSAPKFYEVAKRIIEITEDCIIVAHNAKFDYRILRTEFKRLGYSYKRKSLCTVELAKTLMPEQESYSLGKLARSLGIPVSDRHRANGDAIATVKLFKMLLSKDLEKYIVKDAINVDASEKIKKDHKQIIEGLPADTGVYYIYDKKGTIIFIGKSRNIKHRISQFLTDTNPKSRQIQKQISRVEYELTGNDLIAHLKFREELKKHDPALNDKFTRPLFTYGLLSHTDKDGYINLSIERYSKKKQPIVTLSNLQSARHYITKILEENNLCMGRLGSEITEQGCFNYKVNECNGACLKIESREDYNKRVLKLLDNLDYSDKSIAIIDKGREIDERSVIYVEEGKFMGIGFYNLNFQINNPKILKSIITPMDDSPEVHHLIKSYIKKHRYKKILNLSPA